MQVPAPFEYERATSVDHALGLLDRLGDEARLVAGGHSLIPMMKLRLANLEYLIDINDLHDELGYVRVGIGEVRIGAMTRHRELLESVELAALFPIFADAEAVIADPVVRNRGTIGGSLCQADPSEDLSAVCTTLNASCVIRSADGERSVTMEDFHRGPYETAVAHGEMLTEVRIPVRPNGSSAYAKVERRAGDWAVTSAGRRSGWTAGPSPTPGSGSRRWEPIPPASPRSRRRCVAKRRRRISTPGPVSSPRRPARRSPTTVERPTTSDIWPTSSPDGRCAVRWSESRLVRRETAHRARERKATGTGARDMQVTMTVNGEPVTREIQGRMLLVHFLRDELGLTGTHWGCDTSNCGTCVAWLDGEPVKTCTVLAAMAGGHEVRTVEGLEQDGVLDPIQEGFMRCHGLQCGFCTPGMLMTTRALLDRDPDPSEQTIREAISGQICRCTGYTTIVRSVQWAAAHSGTENETDTEAAGSPS